MRTFHDDLKDMGEAINTDMEVQVVTMSSVHVFNNLNEAREVFALSPFESSEEFTCAMSDSNRMRFETWKVYQALSI